MNYKSKLFYATSRCMQYNNIPATPEISISIETTPSSSRPPTTTLRTSNNKFTSTNHQQLFITTPNPLSNVETHSPIANHSILVKNTGSPTEVTPITISNNHSLKFTPRSLSYRDALLLSQHMIDATFLSPMLISQTLISTVPPDRSISETNLSPSLSLTILNVGPSISPSFTRCSNEIIKIVEIQPPAPAVKIRTSRLTTKQDYSRMWTLKNHH